MILNYPFDFYLIFLFSHKKKFEVHIKIALIGFKGVLQPRPILWLFVHSSQKLQHIGDKKDMFLTGNSLRNLTTALEFH